MSFGQYDLLEVVGRGAMGLVYRARNRETGEPVAMKIIDSRAICSPNLMRRFEQECTAARQLDHPNIVRAIEFGQERGEPYLVMEFVEGQTLAEHVRGRGPLRLSKAVRLTRQLGEALDLVHRQGLVHRDVKPENILVTPDGEPKLGDLGLVKDRSGGHDLTRTGECLGTVDYMPPEQFADARSVDHRSDVYGLAATFYFALTGARPFPAQGDAAILKKKVRNELVPASSLVPGLPGGIDEALRGALHSSPQRRPASCAAFVSALEACGEEKASPALDAAFGETAEPGYERGQARCRRLVGASGDWSAKVRDVSQTELCLELDRRYEPGTLLSVQVGLLESGPSLVCSVRWVRPASPRKWLAGCAFGRRLSAAELSVLVENTSPMVIPCGSADPRSASC